MDVNSTYLAELICTRISHDLIGNIGALSAALELIDENDNVLDEDTKKILSTATQTLKARQKFFRLAFGLDTKKIDKEELFTTGTEYLQTLGNNQYPLTFECENFSPDFAKIYCLCLMCGAELCIKGGQITIGINKEHLKISVISPHKLSALKIEAYQKIITGTIPEENTSQYIQLLYLKEILGAEIPIKLTATEQTCELIIG